MTKEKLINKINKLDSGQIKDIDRYLKATCKTKEIEAKQKQAHLVYKKIYNKVFKNREKIRDKKIKLIIDGPLKIYIDASMDQVYYLNDGRTNLYVGDATFDKCVPDYIQNSIDPYNVAEEYVSHIKKNTPLIKKITKELDQVKKSLVTECKKHKVEYYDMTDFLFGKLN